MKIGPKYKIARRLGAPIFEKTQTQKFALSESKKGKSGGRNQRRRTKTQYGIQMAEKQKARFTYGVSERQFGNYVKQAMQVSGKKPSEALFEGLERRADNVIYRVGFAPTRTAARQMVSHGHILVNGRKITIPSYKLTDNDVISIREGSKEKKIFENIDEKIAERTENNWLSVDVKKKTVTIQAVPTLSGTDLLFDLDVVIEFYSR